MLSSRTFFLYRGVVLAGFFFSALAYPCLPSALSDNVLKIEGIWMRAVPNSLSATALYFTVMNPTGTVYRLKGGKTGVADSLDPMITTHQGQGTQATVGMQSVNELEIPAGGKLTLEPGGNHLMVMGLKQHPAEGTKIPVTLVFEPGPINIEVEATVSRTPVP
ncbi:MAG: copper chaperone PCu(A)C [Verrucomicrobia bacterium]|nr:copper chaperone PCu(A)C [Verrucomicrobiota bacterium]